MHWLFLALALHSSPRDVVKAYLHLDAGGARLSSATWTQVLPLITWSDEPGWDEVAIIAGYDVGAAKTTGDRATVTVTYHTLGVNSDRFQPAPADESVAYKLVREAGIWKIDEPTIRPHVDVATIVAHLRELQRDDPARRPQLEETIRAIERAGRKRGPSSQRTQNH